MATEKQIAASRANGKLSRGPKTPAGKARARLNALKTGLSAADSMIVLLPGESQYEFDAQRELLLADLEPVGAREERLAAEVIDLTWRLRRASKIEQGILVQGVSDADEGYLTGIKQMLEVTHAEVMLRAAGIKDPQAVAEVTDAELHEQLEDMIAKARGEKETGEARLGAAFMIHADAFTRHSRYETALFNRRNRLLEMLSALQAERRGDDS